MKKITAEGIMKKEAGQIRRAIEASCIDGIHRLYPYEFPQGTEQEGRKCFTCYEVEAWKDYQAFIKRHEAELTGYDETFDMPHNIAGIVIKALAGMKAGLKGRKFKDFCRSVAGEIDTIQRHHRINKTYNSNGIADMQNTLKGIISILDTCLALGVPLDDDSPAVSVMLAAMLQTAYEMRKVAE